MSAFTHTVDLRVAKPEDDRELYCGTDVMEGKGDVSATDSEASMQLLTGRHSPIKRSALGSVRGGAFRFWK